MENMLAESEAKYQALLDSSPDGIGISRGGKVIYANKAALEMFGFKTVEEISKGSFLDMVDPRDQAFIQERIEKRLRGEPVEPYFEVKIRRTDGDVRDIEIRTSEIVLNGERLVQGIYRDITERRKIEEALRESERKFRTVLESSLDVIYQVNLKTGKYDYLSPSSKILLGYAPEDFVATTAKDAFAIVYPDDAARVREHFKQLVASAKPGDKMPPIEYRVKHKESGYRWVIDSSSVLFDEQGNPVAIVGTVHDITERRKAEDELWRTRERLQLMFDSVQDGVCVIDTEGRIVDVNPKGLEMYGVSTKEELIGKSTFDLIVPGEQEKAIRELQRVLERGATGLIEHNVVRADGSEYLAELTASVLKDVSGNPTGFVAVLRDITERRKAEDALKESEEKYRALVETAGLAGEGIMMVERNAEGRAVVVFANEALARMLGYKQEEMIGMLGRELFLPGDRVLLHERNRRRRKGEKLPSHSGVMALRKDGSLLPIELSMGAMNLKGKPATVVYIRDVTDRKAAEEALRQSETQFRAIFENAAMGVGIVDSQGRPLKINPAFEKMIGYTLEELRQTPFKKFMHPDDAFSDARLFAEMAEGKRDKYVMEKRYIRKDGQTFWGRLTLSAVRDADGRLSFAVGMIEDITGVKKAEEERLRHIKRIEALYAIAQAASQTLELEELLNLALDKTLEVMAADLGGIYLMDVLEKELALRAAKGLPEDVVEQVSSIKLGTRKIQEIQKWAEGSLTLEDVFGGNVIRQVSKAIGEAQIKSYAVVPFFIRGQLYGLLAVGNRTRREFSTADIDLLKGIANQIGIGTHNAVLYEEVRALIRETLDAQERERERVCLDVHDGVAQTLVAAFQYLQSLEAIAPNEKDIKGLIAKATVQVKKAIQESREIINSLQPATLREVGLVATLRHEMKRLEQETGLKVEFKADDIRLPRDIETGLYRIIHEAVFNARKHSKTRRLRVRINSVNGLVKVEVKDWGKGFAQAHLDSSKRRGTGLFSIRKRTELMKGTCDIKSAPGQGTTVYVEVPFAPAKE